MKLDRISYSNTSCVNLGQLHTKVSHIKCNVTVKVFMLQDLAVAFGRQLHTLEVLTVAKNKKRPHCLCSGQAEQLRTL
jgi:hypothetical protein